MTLVTVALVGVEQGIGVAVGTGDPRPHPAQCPAQLHVLGRIPGTTSWAPLEAARGRAVPGVLVVLFATPLWYANSIHFRAQLGAALKRQPAGRRGSSCSTHSG